MRIRDPISGLAQSRAFGSYASRPAAGNADFLSIKSTPCIFSAKPYYIEKTNNSTRLGRGIEDRLVFPIIVTIAAAAVVVSILIIPAILL